MIFFKTLFIILLLCISNAAFSQRFANQVPQLKRYTPAEVTDSDYGIVIYNKLVQGIGGDSLRYTKDGYNAQGWQEDYYVSGKILHKGYYVDGLIKIFKNFYENGQVERNYTSSDPRRSKMEIFYEDGKVRSNIDYFEGNTQNQYDFFRNGAPEYVEENDKDIEFLYKRNSYFENGNPSSMFELVDKKSKKYIKKEFYENGRLKEEGTMYLRKEMGDYQKEDTWTYYDEKGNVTKTEKYHKGELLN
jgi:translation initiation factor 2 beta subunit (eIF-2beta)/eIF-5